MAAVVIVALRSSTCVLPLILCGRTHFYHFYHYPLKPTELGQISVILSSSRVVVESS